MKKGWKNCPAWVVYRESVLEKRQNNELLRVRLKFNEQMLRVEEDVWGLARQQEKGKM